jgi:hypothetical protein
MSRATTELDAMTAVMSSTKAGVMLGPYSVA